MMIIFFFTYRALTRGLLEYGFRFQVGKRSTRLTWLLTIDMRKST